MLGRENPSYYQVISHSLLWLLLYMLLVHLPRLNLRLPEPKNPARLPTDVNDLHPGVMGFRVPGIEKFGSTVFRIRTLQFSGM